MDTKTVSIRPPESLRVLFLDLNSFFASVEQQRHRALRGKPVAVVPCLSKHTCVIAASYEAKRYGIRTGTSVKEALARCPDLLLRLARHEHYVEVHHHVVSVVSDLFPDMTVHSIDEMACTLFANDQHPDVAKRWARLLKQAIYTHVGECLHVSIGIAPNRFLAKVASKLQKPNGLVLLEPAALPGPLLGLEPMELPGLGKNMQSRLHKVGLYSMQQLWDASPQQLRRVWGGVCGEQFWYDLHGYTRPAEVTTRNGVSHSHVLSFEMRPWHRMRQVAQRLLIKAATRMRRLGYSCRNLSLSIRVEKGPRLEQTCRFEPTKNTFLLLEKLGALFDAWQPHLESYRIKKVGLVLHGLLPEQAVSLNLFEQPAVSARRRQNALCRTIDTINERYGRDTVKIGFLPDLHKQDTGTKIAFDRVPELAEFHD